MAFRLYIVPVLGAGTSRADARRPKYFEILANWSAADYGFEPWMIVGADLSVADNAAMVAHADVMALPFDLTAFLTSGQVTAVQNTLEAIHVPALWVTTSMTWLTVVRTVLGVFHFFQRFGGIYAEQTGAVPPSIFTSGVTLTTTFGALPLAVQTAMLSAAVSLNISTAGLTANTTLRVILKSLADTFSAQQYDFNGTLL